MRNQTTVSAAEELGISQPAVSNALKTLEKQLNMPLFERTNRGLVPTSEAHLIFDEIQPIFAMLRGIAEQVRATRGAKTGRLRITATPPLSQSVIPIALKRFVAERKDVRISYDIRGLDAILREVESGAIDLGLLLGLESHPSCTVIPLHEGEMECVLPADHPLAEYQVITPADIAKHNQIGLGLDHESKLGALVRAAFAMQRVSFDTNLEVRYCHTACVLADAGLGVAVVDSFTARFMQHDALVRRKFEPHIKVIASAVVRADRTLSLVATAFIDEIRSVLGKLD